MERLRREKLERQKKKWLEQQKINDRLTAQLNKLQERNDKRKAEQEARRASMHKKQRKLIISPGKKHRDNSSSKRHSKKKSENTSEMGSTDKPFKIAFTPMDLEEVDPEKLKIEKRSSFMSR